jgi:hypothetical protein
MNVSPFVKYTTLQIAKGMTPYDTGNMRHNAIRLTNIKNDGWTIRYSTTVAPYIEPQEEGWHSPSTGELHTKNKGFIKATTNEIAVYLKRKLEGKKTYVKHSRLSDRSIDRANDEQRAQREIRRINSLAKYELGKDNMKNYSPYTKDLEVNL